jgi:hypothetical protein
MPEQYDHGKNLIGTVRIELFRQIIHFAGVRRFGETQPVAEWNCRALSGKLPTRSAGPRHRSERTAPEAPSCRLPPLLSRRPDASGSSQRDSQPPDRLPAAGPHHRSATTRRFASPPRPRGVIPSESGSYSVSLLLCPLFFSRDKQDPAGRQISPSRPRDLDAEFSLPTCSVFVADIIFATHWARKPCWQRSRTTGIFLD